MKTSVLYVLDKFHLLQCTTDFISECKKLFPGFQRDWRSLVSSNLLSARSYSMPVKQEELSTGSFEFVTYLIDSPVPIA